MNVEDYLHGFEAGFTRKAKATPEGTHRCECVTCALALLREAEKATQEERACIEQRAKETSRRVQAEGI